MTLRISAARNEKGVALPLALFALVLLSGLLLAFLGMSLHEPQIAQNHGSASRALHIADAGIEHAWAVVPSALSAQVFGGGSYSVTVITNADGTYTLTSTGTYKDAVRYIKAVVSAAGPPAAKAAAEILTDTSNYEFGADPAGSFDGRDWSAPANISACTNITGCGTLMDPTDYPSTHGAFVNQSGGVFEVTGGGTMFGTGCSSGCTGGGGDSKDIDTTVPITRWDNFINAAILMAKPSMIFDGTVLESPSTTVTWGTRAAPEITVINNTANVSWKTNVKGVGVLIIDSPGPTQNLVFSNGELNWEGLVIVRSPGEVQFEIETGSGKIRVFGQLVNRSAGKAEIELNKATNFIKYSSAAIKLATKQFSGFKSWKEVAAP